jgi:hypothetical protein
MVRRLENVLEEGRLAASLYACVSSLAFKPIWIQMKLLHTRNPDSKVTGICLALGLCSVGVGT